MFTVKLSVLKKDMDNIINQIIKSDEPVRVKTKNGNAVILSESNYKSYLETLYLISITGMKDSLLEGKNATARELINADEVEF